MESNEVFTVGGQLSLEFVFRQIQFRADNFSALAQSLEPLLRIPIKEPGTAIDKIFQGTNHFVTAYIFDLSPDGLYVRSALVNLGRLCANFAGIEAIALIEHSKI